jgi:glycosyltransferase involved in cell wall biosynthesis
MKCQLNKKVLFVLHLPPPVHGSSMVGQYIKESECINQELDSRYINLGTSKSIEEIGKNPLQKVGAYLKILGSTLKLLLFFKPDLVYLAITAKGIGFYKDVVVVFMAKLFGAKLVLHFHNKGVSDNHDRFFDSLLYKVLFKNTKVILLSKYLYYDIKKYVKEDEVYYCPNGIPEIEFQANAKKNNKNPIQLLFLSNLIESKGVYVLLEAIEILQTKQVSFHCSFVGGIGDVSEVQFIDNVQELNIEDRVSYLGKRYRKEKEIIYQQADVFVLPTFYGNECFPLVLLEAMQFSLPVVSTFEGGIPDVVEDGVTGFLVPQKNAQALADKLEILINNPEMRQQMGDVGREKYEKEFTLTTFENTLTNILKTISK